MSHNIAMRCDERVAVRTLETIVRRVYGKREAALACSSLGNTRLTMQQPVRRVALCIVSRLVGRKQELPCLWHCTRERSPK